MKKQIVIIALTLAAFTSSFAATGKGYRILGSEIHSAPGFNLHVEEVAPGTAKAQKNAPSSGHTSTSVPGRNGRAHQSVQVDAYHDFNITNNTGQKQLYEQYVSIDCDNMHNYFIEHVEVYPGGHFSDSKHSFGTVQEAYTGSYRIDAETRLSGESSDSSRDSNNLYISN